MLLILSLKLLLRLLLLSSLRALIQVLLPLAWSIVKILLSALTPPVTYKPTAIGVGLLKHATHLADAFHSP